MLCSEECSCLHIFYCVSHCCSFIFLVFSSCFSILILFCLSDDSFFVHLFLPTILRILPPSEDSCVAGLHHSFLPLILFLPIFLSSLVSLLPCRTMIMINNSVFDESLGKVNGLGQSMAALARTIGPALGGLLWSISVEVRYDSIFDSV